ncbi:MAG: 4-hydroxy-tetrahydrodipicolinate reductase [Oscillospiraceae bacterium]|jgi:4-hydroxy-tetrahydrodipicolinate reductase
MMKVIVNGALGHMGVEVLKRVNAGVQNSTLAAAVDYNGGNNGVYRSLFEFTGEADVIIDFSHHAATPELLQYACKRGLPVVLATTGHTEEELVLIAEAAKEIPIFKSANMSVGVALLTKLAKQAAAVFGDADIEIIEKHHNRKLDAPSGTALMLADAIREIRPNSNYVYGREGRSKREPDDITIHAVRMGNVVGEHEIFFATGSQTISLRHEAHDRALFADGAMPAAAFLIGKPAGMYNMDDLLNF